MSAPPEEAHGGHASSRSSRAAGRDRSVRGRGAKRRALQIGTPLEDRQRPFCAIGPSSGRRRATPSSSGAARCDRAAARARSSPPGRPSCRSLRARTRGRSRGGPGSHLPGWARCRGAPQAARLGARRSRPRTRPRSRPAARKSRGPRMRRSRLLPRWAADLAELERALREIHQTGTPKSRSAELSESCGRCSPCGCR